MYIIWVDRGDKNSMNQVKGSRLEITAPLLIVGFRAVFTIG